MKFFYKIFILSFALAFETQAINFSVIPILKIGLEDAEIKVSSHSESLKSILSSVESSQFQSKSAKASAYPNLSLQATYFYQTEVPKSSLGPVGSITFGTHNNYAIGPVLTYTLFDNNKESKSAQSYDLLALSKIENYKALKKQLELNIRQVYFRVQYALKELILTANSLKISQAEQRDIDLKWKAGASSRLDLTQAHRDVISYQLKYKQAQTQLANELRELIALTGVGDELDTSRPIPEELISSTPRGIESPTLRVDLDSLEATLKKFSATPETFKQFTAPTDNHPELQSLNHEAESSRLASESEKSGLLPKIQFLAKSQYIYPDAILPKNIIQNTIGVTLSVPLYEGEATRSRSALKMSEAMSSEYRKKQRLSDLNRDFLKAHDVITSLHSQKLLSEQSVHEAGVVEHLTYQSYKAGKNRYLDVQDANLKLLEAEVNHAKIESSILMETAALSYLSSIDTK
ncbi:MAG: TolC family protein [Bacteriovorax sp.]|nr:TolC family protein [Bacteriovorax sp.]